MRFAAKSAALQNGGENPVTAAVVSAAMTAVVSVVVVVEMAAVMGAEIV
jgi:hypothetical protein